MYSNAALAMLKSSFDVGGERNHATRRAQHRVVRRTHETTAGARSAMGSMATSRRNARSPSRTTVGALATCKVIDQPVAVGRGDDGVRADTGDDTAWIAAAAKRDDAPAQRANVRSVRRSRCHAVRCKRAVRSSRREARDGSPRSALRSLRARARRRHAAHRMRATAPPRHSQNHERGNDDGDERPRDGAERTRAGRGRPTRRTRANGERVAP